MMDALTGDVADVLRIRNTFPFMKILPDDRIVLNDNSTYLIFPTELLLTYIFFLEQCVLFNGAGKKLEKVIKLTLPTTFIGTL